MNQFIERIRIEVAQISMTRTGRHMKTGDIRAISSKMYRSLEDKSKQNVFAVCALLLNENDWAMGVIAFDFAYRVRKQYHIEDFELFESWLIKYVRGWGDCDDFCTHGFGELINQYPSLFDKVFLWTNHEAFWVRRAAAVILIPMIHKGNTALIDPFVISDVLLNDPEPLVLKGYGWMLKEFSITHEDAVVEYLMKHKNQMPRISFRYALGKLDKTKRERLMKAD